MKRALLLLALAGCAIHPEGEDEERKRALRAYPGGEVMDVAPDATLDLLLRRAYLANGDLRRRWWEWRAALEEVPQAGSQKANIGFSYEQMFDGSSTDRTMSTFGVQTDPMGNLVWPGRLSADARKALEFARAAGFRFDAARLDLVSKTRQAWLDLAYTAEEVRLQESNVALAQAILESIEARVTAGRAPQQDVLKARTARDLAADALESARARLPGRRAALNALLAREPKAPLATPPALPEPRPLPHDDAALLGFVAARHPELKALAAEAAGREEGVRRMRMEWIPELSGGFSFDLNGAARTLMAMLSAPLLRYEAIRAGVEQAQAELEAARAMRRQAEVDLKSRVIVALSDFRNVERRIALYEDVLVPRSEQAVDAARAAYSGGQTPSMELIDALRMRIDLRMLRAELRIEREKLLAELEALGGLGP